MERPAPLERLNSLENLIADGRQRVQRQRLLVHKMNTYGVDDRAARALLDDLETALALYVVDREDLARAERRPALGSEQVAA